METQDLPARDKFNKWAIAASILVIPQLILWFSGAIVVFQLETALDPEWMTRFYEIALIAGFFICPIPALVSAIVAILKIIGTKEKGVSLGIVSVAISSFNTILLVGFLVLLLTNPIFLED